MTVKIYMIEGDKTIPMLTIDKDGKVTRYISKEKRKEYEEKIGKRIGESLSRYYSAHPELLK